MKQLYKIDSDGFYIEPVVVKDDLTDVDIPPDMINICWPSNLYRPKWTGTEWVEGMPQIEIDTMNAPVESVDVEAELDSAIMSATTLEELKGALVGKNRTVRVRGKQK